MTATAKRPSALLSPTLLAFLAVFFARLLVLARFSHSPYLIPEGEDMKFYNDWALRITRGVTDSHAFYGLPGYAWFLAAVYSVFGYNPFTVGLLQCISEGLIGTVLFQLSRAVFGAAEKPGERVAAARANIIGALAILGWIFLQPAEAFSIILMPTTWLVLAYWACVLWILRTRGTSLWNPWFLMGLLAGVVAMMVATILFVIPMIFAAILWKLDREKPLPARLPKITAACCVTIVGTLLGASPCWIHNYFIAHEPVFLSAHSGVNFYIGNNPLANGYPKIPPGLRAGQEGMLKDSITMAEKAEGHPLTRVEVSRFWSAKAKEYIHSHFLEWIRLMAVKFKNFWNAFQYDDLSFVSILRDEGILTPGIRFGLAAALGIPGMIIAWFKFPRSRWITAAILLHMCALLPVFITERYRLAAAPGLLLMAAFGLWECWHCLALAEWREPALYGSLTLLSTLFVSWPESAPGLWSLDFYNTGIKAIAAGKLVRARANLERAYDYVPQNSEINFAIGNLWLAMGDPKKAEACYWRTLQINPNHAGAYNNLGVIEIRNRQWGPAARLLGLSLAIEPDDSKAHFLLAQTLLEENDLPQAAVEIDKAIELGPDRAEFKSLQTAIKSRRPQ